MDNGKIQILNDATQGVKQYVYSHPVQEKFGSDHCTIHHPRHYTQGKIEVIDFIKDQQMNYNEGNIIKYICRYRYKNGIEDLRKALWYLEDLINDLDKLQAGTP